MSADWTPVLGLSCTHVQLLMIDGRVIRTSPSPVTPLACERHRVLGTLVRWRIAANL